MKPRLAAAGLALVVTLVILSWALLPATAWQGWSPQAGADPAQWLAQLLGFDRHPALQFIIIALATLVSEDLTCIGAGLLASRTELTMVMAVAASGFGIWVGDLGLYLAGRFIGSHGGWDQKPAVRSWGERFNRDGWALIFASRFMPGARLPLYLAIGVCGGSMLGFMLWTALAAAVWTPLVVLGAAWVGGDVLGWFEHQGVSLWLVGPLAVIGFLIVMRLAVLLVTADGRRKAVVTFERWRRIEFWPGWLFYLPIVPWCTWLTIKARDMMVFSAANPCIPDGGIIGESKSALQRLLPPQWTIPGALIAPGQPADRLAHLQRVMRFKGWDYPLILKPDAGQRGVGVKRVKTEAEAFDYLTRAPDPLQMQPWHPGPYEVGIFYYRLPDAASGHILAVTHKEFPVLSGDGVHSLGHLIQHHPRFRLQEEVFRERHEYQWNRIPAAGETVVLTRSGNHAQGTLFRDGAHLVTPALTRRIDEIARSIHGFYFGRFDIRYRDPAAFARGEDLAIVELNGVTSECTNIYDPDWSPWRSWRLLAHQWTILVQIGCVWRARGAPVLRFGTLLQQLRAHYRNRSVPLVGD